MSPFPALTFASLENLPLWIGLCASGWGLAAWSFLRKPTPPAPPPPSPAPNPAAELPIIALQFDLRPLHQELEQLRKQGLSSIAAHLDLHRDLPRAWRSKALVKAASPAALQTANSSVINAVQDWWNLQDKEPWNTVFSEMITLLWNDLDRMEQILIHKGEKFEERWSHLRCTLPRERSRLDPSRCLVGVTDLTLAKTGKHASSLEDDLLHDIFAQANLLLWRAKVLRENGRLLWRMSLPPHANASSIFKLAGALELGGLWDLSRMPDAQHMSETSERALLGGQDHYSQEFRALGQDGTHWLHEDVVVQRIADNEWNLVAVVTDVTDRHHAEQAREESQFQVQQILKSADVLLWRAQVVSTPPSTFWKMYVPPSVLYRRIFGYDPDNNTPLLWQNQEIPERDEIYARSTKALHENWPGYEQEFRVISRGTTFWLHEHVSIQRKSDTEWTLVGVIMDVTARRLAEQELVSEKARLARALDTLVAAGLRQPEEPVPTPSRPAPEPGPAPTSARGLHGPTASQPPFPAPGPGPAPAASSEAPPATAALPPQSAPPPLSGRLLLMDDEEPIQRLAMRLIKRLGLEVEVCSNGEQALALYKAAMDAGKRFDIVMMDLRIPGGLGGRETIGPLRSLDPNVRALVSSGANAELLPGEITALGFVGAVPKPYDVATLTRVFRSVLETGRAA